MGQTWFSPRTSLRIGLMYILYMYKCKDFCIYIHNVVHTCMLSTLLSNCFPHNTLHSLSTFIVCSENGLIVCHVIFLVVRRIIHVSYNSTFVYRPCTCTWITALLKWRTYMYMYLWLSISRKTYKTMANYWLHKLTRVHVVMSQCTCYKNTNHSEIVWFTGKLVLVKVEKVV